MFALFDCFKGHVWHWIKSIDLKYSTFQLFPLIYKELSFIINTLILPGFIDLKYSTFKFFSIYFSIVFQLLTVSRAMCDTESSRSDKLKLLRVAGERHQMLYKSAMNGEGIDRHLFALYVVSRGLGYESQFLEDIIKRPWTLSTSQQPQQQVFNSNLPDINFAPFRKMCSPGGGFGPVSDDGYGVSYMLPTDYNIFFHVSSKRSCNTTDSRRFAKLIAKSLEDMRALFDDTPVKQLKKAP